MIDRRMFTLTLVAGLVGHVRAAAAQPATVPRVGLIATEPALRQGFLDGLRDAGHVDGQNIRVELRSVPGGSEAGARAVIDELDRLGAAVIVATGPNNIKAAQQGARAPIVAIDMESDPVAAGFVKSLGRPGGNITGLFLDLPELGGKQVQLLQEALGPLPRVGVVWDDRIGRPQFDATSAPARAANISVASLPIRRPEDIDPLFASAAKSGAKAVVLLTAPVILQNRARIAERAIRRRLPSISVFTLITESGGLLGYGPDFALIFRRAASYIDRILRGAQPADLPVERPTKFELVVNLKTAKALHLSIPPAIVLRADRVIE